jgi:hypothetical protein
MLVHKTARLETARSACYAAIPWLLQPALPQAHVTLNPDAPCFTPPHNISLLARTRLACLWRSSWLARSPLAPPSLCSIFLWSGLLILLTYVASDARPLPQLVVRTTATPHYCRSHYCRSLYLLSLSTANRSIANRSAIAPLTLFTLATVARSLHACDARPHVHRSRCRLMSSLHGKAYSNARSHRGPLALPTPGRRSNSTDALTLPTHSGHSTAARSTVRLSLVALALLSRALSLHALPPL